jgi:hypothetical protein
MDLGAMPGRVLERGVAQDSIDRGDIRHEVGALTPNRDRSMLVSRGWK